MKTRDELKAEEAQLRIEHAEKLKELTAARAIVERLEREERALFNRWFDIGAYLRRNKKQPK